MARRRGAGTGHDDAGRRRRTPRRRRRDRHRQQPLRPVAADRRKRAGSGRRRRPVLAGTLNLDAPVDVRVSHAGDDTTLADIARLMEASDAGPRRAMCASPTAPRGSMRRRCTRWPLLSFDRLDARRGGLLQGAGDRRGGADHHLPLRARAGGAGGAGRRQRGADARRDHGQGRLGARAAGRGRPRAVRQDRHADDGRAAARSGGLDALPQDAAGIALALASHSRHPLVARTGQGAGGARHTAGTLDRRARGRPATACSPTHDGACGRAAAARMPPRGTAAALDIAGQPARLIPLRRPLAARRQRGARPSSPRYGHRQLDHFGR